MKGLEPSTFCMAIGRCELRNARYSCKSDGSAHATRTLRCPQIAVDTRGFSQRKRNEEGVEPCLRHILTPAPPRGCSSPARSRRAARGRRRRQQVSRRSSTNLTGRSSSRLSRGTRSPPDRRAPSARTPTGLRRDDLDPLLREAAVEAARDRLQRLAAAAIQLDRLALELRRIRPPTPLARHVVHAPAGSRRTQRSSVHETGATPSRLSLPPRELARARPIYDHLEHARRGNRNPNSICRGNGSPREDPTTSPGKCLVAYRRATPRGDGAPLWEAVSAFRRLDSRNPGTYAGSSCVRPR
jgi:hypothetical protein